MPQHDAIDHTSHHLWLLMKPTDHPGCLDVWLGPRCLARLETRLKRAGCATALPRCQLQLDQRRNARAVQSVLKVY